MTGGTPHPTLRATFPSKGKAWNEEKRAERSIILFFNVMQTDAVAFLKPRNEE